MAKVAEKMTHMSSQDRDSNEDAVAEASRPKVPKVHAPTVGQIVWWFPVNPDMNSKQMPTPLVVQMVNMPGDGNGPDTPIVAGTLFLQSYSVEARLRYTIGAVHRSDKVFHECLPGQEHLIDPERGCWTYPYPDPYDPELGKLEGMPK